MCGVAILKNQKICKIEPCKNVEKTQMRLKKCIGNLPDLRDLMKASS